MPHVHATLHARITAEIARLDQALGETAAAAAPVALDQSSVGRLSRMDALQQQAMARGMRDRMAVQRRGLQAALARLEAGTYGRCCQCQADIPQERLITDPAVVFCSDCLAEREASGPGQTTQRRPRA